MNTTSDPVHRGLPELADDTIARMERDLFADIGSERSPRASRASRRRRTGWMTAGAAAAVIVVAAVIAPTVQGLVAGSSGGSVSLTDSAVAPAPGLEAATEGGAFSTEDGRSMSDPDEALSPMNVRDVIATANATVEVSDAATAAQQIGADAEGRGGYVESMTLDGTSVVAQSREEMGDGLIVVDPSMPYYGGGNQVSVRVPSDQLTEVIAGLSDLGEVKASSINRQDVTEQTLDLRARIDAAEASVERLTELMAQSATVADLIAAEQALADRQSVLESYQQQLTSLETQVSLSTLTVNLVEPADVVTADPAGFGDGLAAGWSGLVATLNGIVVALGFLLPWLVIAGIVVLVVWGIRRAVKRRRSAPPADAEE
jgi:hypothetical protein